MFTMKKIVRLSLFFRYFRWFLVCAYFHFFLICRDRGGIQRSLSTFLKHLLLRDTFQLCC